MRRLRRPKHIEKTQCSLKIKTGEIPYLLSRSTARRTLTVSIDERANVSVAAPFRMNEKEIHDFLHEKSDWISDKIKEAEKSKAILEDKSYEDGKYFLFLGNKYKLNVFERNVKRGHVSFNEHDGWYVTVPSGMGPSERDQKVKDKMIKWYRKQAQEILGGRIFHYSRIMEVEPKKIAVRTQKRLWGCCDYNTQTIHLNWQIILSPLEVIDYVVVHEMCHLTIPNHSKRFWKKVERYMPNFELYKEWLGANQLDMALP